MSAGNPNKRRQAGFTYIAVMIAVGATGAGLAAVTELTSHAEQREKEAQLLFVGNEFRQAITAYYERTPGAVKRYPQTLEALLEDKRFPMAQRHLRRVYPDPITNQRDWGLMEAPGGGIMGVYSLSEKAPLKTANFAVSDLAFTDAVKYSDWQFFYNPQPPAVAPGNAEKTSSR
jgi:type II secretory pathway pseudopilin PulG